MAQIIKSAETKIITKNGECQLSITIEPIVVEVTVHLEGGQLVTQATARPETKEEETKTFVAPDFGGGMFDTKKINFGKGI